MTSSINQTACLTLCSRCACLGVQQGLRSPVTEETRLPYNDRKELEESGTEEPITLEGEAPWEEVAAQDK